ncbi:MAG: DsbA family protein [Polyangiaceae bacterium]|nr:DsbA family protein [Polyangiaceae bacterium]
MTAAASSPVTVQYFSDVLCVWAYVGQARLDELEAEFGAEVSVDCHFMTVFGDARSKLEQRWAERGGLAAYADHVRGVVSRFDHVSIHPDAWARAAPTSSLGCHIFLAAVKLYDREAFRRAAWALRLAFFRDGIDISQRKAQLEVGDRLGLSVPAIEELLYSGRAHAELSRGIDLALSYGVEVSPSFVFNEGRQRLNGNVGYRVIEANVRELLRSPEQGHSWC